MNLDDIVEKIVRNRGISELLMDIFAGGAPREHPFKKLVEFQRCAYAREKLSLQTEGFQAGEPWNGDIENARVAFISSNPAFNPCDDLPRYHAQANTLSMPGGPPLTAKDVRNFFINRFQNPKSVQVAPNKVLRARCVTQGAEYYDTVPYWGCVRNSVEMLWPAAPQLDGADAYVRNLMGKAVLIELVPFKSSSQTGVQEALYSCVRNFARHILPHVAAPIIVLVGKTARSAFLDYALVDETEWGTAAADFENKAAYIYNGPLFSGQKHIVSVDFNSGSFGLSSGCSEETLTALRKIF
jgi:hypothetical protein